MKEKQKQNQESSFPGSLFKFLTSINRNTVYAIGLLVLPAAILFAYLTGTKIEFKDFAITPISHAKHEQLHTFQEGEKAFVPVDAFLEVSRDHFRAGMTVPEIEDVVKQLIEDNNKMGDEIERMKALRAARRDSLLRYQDRLSALDSTLEACLTREKHTRYTIYFFTSDDNRHLTAKMAQKLKVEGFRVTSPEDWVTRTKNNIIYFSGSDEAKEVATEVITLLNTDADLAVDFPEAPSLQPEQSRQKDVLIELKSNLHAGGGNNGS
ncbi:MAG: hypothetical protein ACE5IY_15625 [bacterium]